MSASVRKNTCEAVRSLTKERIISARPSYTSHIKASYRVIIKKPSRRAGPNSLSSWLGSRASTPPKTDAGYANVRMDLPVSSTPITSTLTLRRSAINSLRATLVCRNGCTKAGVICRAHVVHCRDCSMKFLMLRGLRKREQTIC